MATYNMLLFRINSQFIRLDNEIEFSNIRSQGAQGQHANKASTAVHLRFDIRASSLPRAYKERLLNLHDRRINSDGIIVIKAQRHRSREKNRQEALLRLSELIRTATAQRKKRLPTRPTRASQKRRLEHKMRKGRKKALRRKVLE